DVDGNGSVGLEDALLVLRYCLDLSSLTPDEIQAADANGDGVVSIADVVLVLRRAVLGTSI
ncbi:MAG TPA: dockerin type I repeat-containing protein, partial [Armatimonadota bacterium]